MIPTFPVNGRLKFKVTGNFPLVPPTSVPHKVTLSVPDGMTELNPTTPGENYNYAEANTAMETLDVDLAVVSYSQSHTGSIATHSVVDEALFQEKLVVDNPEPMSFKVKFENKGPGAADGAEI